MQFDYAKARFEDSGLRYRPDPDNLYTLLPSYPDTALLRGGKFTHYGSDVGQLSVGDNNLSQLGVKPGDVLSHLRNLRASSVFVRDGSTCVSHGHTR